MKQFGSVEDAALVPLVLDVDGSLLLTDLLLENLWAALRVDLLATLRTVATSIRTPARLKQQLSMIASPDPSLLPVRAAVLDLARQAAMIGRPVLLVSGADQVLVDGLAQQLGLPGPHFGSDGKTNLTGASKSRLLVSKFGEGGFDYVGNAAEDLMVWQHARRCIVVAPGAQMSRRVATLEKPVEVVGSRWKLSSLIAEMRPHQWAKNLLLLLPLLAAHGGSFQAVLSTMLAIAAFCAGASSLYLVNDMLDLGDDRQHPEKRSRPLASGALPLAVGMIASVCLGVSAVLVSWAVAPDVTGLLVLYMTLSLAYSLSWKQIRWVDLFVLATLYVLRVLTGAAASNIAVSAWLIAFCFAVFFTLGIVKRLTALARATNGGTLPGRGYSAAQLKGLQRLALLTSLASAAIFLGYSLGPDAGRLYSSPEILRWATVPIGFWLMRMVILSRQGREDFDPMVFVAHDRTGLAIVATGLALVALSI
ncbi:UbiA family prenyltransferase [Pseudooceanicola sp.]|uniref:UbiA family prenyltransferase n=1 Tax=Pseudooceanicola sp. TaxID=1914328 RepID=UPI0026215BA8|nr:UbiA family prenyltransferase [Pseudooceanicola sp.]MDF1855902.1 UbiA family prenyltransferase [Pseudooceanicola sp.]